MAAKPFLARLGLTIPAAMLLTLGVGANVVLDTATGSQIGTSSSQKLGFYGATPIVRPASTTDLRTALINLGLYATGGASPLNLNGGALTAQTVTASSLTAGRITTAGASGLLQDFAGLAIVGTPSATAPSTGTNGPGNINGVVSMGADGSGSSFTALSPGNGSTGTVNFFGYVTQGTAATPAATGTADNCVLGLRGHDGTNYTGTQASVQIIALSAWTPTSREAAIRFRSTASGSTTLTTAGQVDGNQTLVWGGAFNGSGTFSAGTLRPHIQTASTSSNNAGIVQTMWAANGVGPIGIFAKSRSGTVGTQGIITTGDVLGTISWQADDGANFIQAAAIVGISEGTIAIGQVPGRLRVITHNSAGTPTQAGFIDSSQVWGLTTSTATPSALYTGGTITPKLQIAGSGGNAALACAQHSANATGPTLYLGKSRSATVFTGMTVVNAGDALGTIDFQGADTNNFVSGAQIVVQATGTPASTRMGASMLFKTATDAAPSVMTTALTIDNTQMATFAGDVTHADAKNLIFNTSTGSKIGTATGQKIGFWNATPVIQQAGANQVAPAAYATGAFGLDSNAHMQALYDLVVAIRTALVNTGIIKGAA